MRTRLFLVALSWAAATTGCECGSGGEEQGGDDEGPRARTGTIVGIVRLADGASIPEYPQSPTQVEGRPAISPDCAPPRQADRTPVTVAEESGGLVGLEVDVTGADEASWPRPGEPVTHELVIRDCRLTPQTIVATVGDRLRLSYEHPEHGPFFVDLGDGMMQFRSEGREITLDQGGVRSITCAGGLAAPCGRTEVVTLYHPVHTVTGADGRFRVEGVPADQPVRVHAWHPLFEEAFASTTVAPGETVEVELTIRPIVTAPPPPTEPRPEGPVELTPDPNAPF